MSILHTNPRLQPIARVATVTIVCLLLVSFPLCAADTNHDGLETILLPFAFLPGVELHGAFGTIWQGEVWVHNRSAQTIALQLLLGCATEDCVAQYRPNFVGRLSSPLDNVPDQGILLTPRVDDAPFLSFSNRIFEVTRHAQPQGIEIPVIREEQFLTGTTTLLGIPVAAGVRSALRVYDPRRIAGATVRVEAIDANGVVVGSTELTTTFSFGGGSDPIRPGYAMIGDLTNAFPAVRNLDHFHLRITPVIAGTEFWAMVSVTDNDTQQVLLITPQ